MMTASRSSVVRRAVLVLLGLVVVAGAVLALYARNQGYRIGTFKVGTSPAERVEVRIEANAENRTLNRVEAPGPDVQNVILIIGDGLGFTQLLAARTRLVGAEGRLFMERLPFGGSVTTTSATSVYTDSGAAATALATGRKTTPYRLSLSPEGEVYDTVVEIALAKGARVGMVTSSVFFDATPAAFASHVSSRREFEEISRQMAGSGVELLVSEGWEVDEENRERSEKVLGEFSATGFRLVRDMAGLAQSVSSPEPILGLLAPGSISLERETTLDDLAEIALARFASAESFFLLIEDEETDTGGHVGDLNRVIRAIEDLDAVTRRAVEFARQDGRTLVIVTSDHETGGLAIVDGPEGGELEYWWGTSGHTAAPVPIFAFGPGSERFGRALDNTEVPALIADSLGLDLLGGSRTAEARGEGEEKNESEQLGAASQ